MSHDNRVPPQKPPPPAPTTKEPTGSETSLRVCPVCGGALIEIRHKLTCSRCHSICETCCEGGRG
ncbi:MAG: hypothetical protein H7062_08930 [Candidatus Saccharimonas sp.]|nr:hypothetical protein [Planctomycetaceae bacterium]